MTDVNALITKVSLKHILSWHNINWCWTWCSEWELIVLIKKASNCCAVVLWLIGRAAVIFRAIFLAGPTKTMGRRQKKGILKLLKKVQRQVSARRTIALSLPTTVPVDLLAQAHEKTHYVSIKFSRKNVASYLIKLHSDANLRQWHWPGYIHNCLR